MDVTDKLIKSCINNERKGQKALYELSYGYLMKISFRYAKVEDEALEYLNIGFCKILQGLEKKPSKMPYKFWARKILINSIIDECISLVELQALFHNIHISRNFQADLPLAVIDPSQIERVFMNLIINAAEAMDGSGHLTINTRENNTTEQIEIAFSDTGHGISAENLRKIFDPFFTTKDVGHGTGLGLAISYGLVHSHQGSISVDSIVGEGTTFRLIINVS